MERDSFIALLDIFVFGDKDDFVIIEIVKQCSGLVINQRDELVAAGERDTRIQHIRFFLQGFLGFFAFAAAQIGCFFADFCRQLLLGVNENLARGGQGDFLAVFGSALGLDVKVVDGVDGIAPKLDTHGRGAVGHEQIDNAAADRKLAAALDVVASFIAEQDERFFEFGEIDFHIGLQHPRYGAQGRFRYGELRRRVERRNHNVVFAVRHPAENIEPLMLVFMGFYLRGDVGEILFRINQRAHAHRAEVVAENLRFLLVLGNTKGSDGVVPAERRDNICFVNARNADSGSSGFFFYRIIKCLEFLCFLDNAV